MEKDDKTDFDSAAAGWDEKPGRVRLADDIADAVARQVNLHPDMNVMDFGCGTGLLTLRLQPRVGTITGVDSSSGMLAVLREKVSRQGLSNVKAVQLDIEEGHALPGFFHLIVSAMTLHHIQDVDKLLEQFNDALLPGGGLCIADLDSEEGQFHEDNTGVQHFGFDRKALGRKMEAAGFEDIRETTAAEINKQDSEGHAETFTVFLLAGRKRD